MEKNDKLRFNHARLKPGSSEVWSDALANWAMQWTSGIEAEDTGYMITYISINTFIFRLYLIGLYLVSIKVPCCRCSLYNTCCQPAQLSSYNNFSIWCILYATCMCIASLCVEYMLLGTNCYIYQIIHCPLMCSTYMQLCTRKHHGNCLYWEIVLPILKSHSNNLGTMTAVKLLCWLYGCVIRLWFVQIIV